MDIIAVTYQKAVAFGQLILTTITTYLLGGSNTYLMTWLFQSNTQIGPTTPLTALVECNYSGYARQTVAAFNGPYIQTSTGISYVTTAEQIFANNGGGTGNNVYSSALVAQIPGSTAATGTITTTAGVLSAPVLTLGGGPYAFPPTVTITGGGTGGAVTAVLTGTTVTGLILDAAGTGYTAATLVFDPPIQIIAFNNFSSPIPLNVLGDAAPIISQINQPAG